MRTHESGFTLSRTSESRGFTLIELLVVIAIIGILSSVVLASLNGARKKGRDARRKTDMKQLQVALEMYYDTNNAYPSSSGVWRGEIGYGGYGTGASGYVPGLAPTYIPLLPAEPTANPDGYLYLSDGVNYKLLSHVSPETYPPANDAFYDPVRPTWAWMICSGPPACTTW